MGPEPMIRIFLISVRLGTTVGFRHCREEETATPYRHRFCVEADSRGANRAKLAKPNKRGQRIKEGLHSCTPERDNTFPLSLHEILQELEMSRGVSMSEDVPTSERPRNLVQKSTRARPLALTCRRSIRDGLSISEMLALESCRRTVLFLIGLWLTWFGWSIRMFPSSAFLDFEAWLFRGKERGTGLGHALQRVEVAELGLIALSIGVAFILLSAFSWLRAGTREGVSA